jgi:hypothetical protein
MYTFLGVCSCSLYLGDLTLKFTPSQRLSVAEQRFRVLVVATHPVQYMAPILRRLSNHPRLQLKVAYCSLRGAEAALDPEFGATVRWDVPLLDGYDWVEVPNKGSGAESFFGLYNPGLWHLIRKGNFDAILCFVGYVRGSFWIALAAARLTNSAFLFGCQQPCPSRFPLLESFCQKTLLAPPLSSR